MIFTSKFKEKDIPLSISPIFYGQIFCNLSFAKKLQTHTIRAEKLCKTLSYKKAAGKMQVKLTLKDLTHSDENNYAKSSLTETRENARQSRYYFWGGETERDVYSSHAVVHFICPLFFHYCTLPTTFWGAFTLRFHFLKSCTAVY